jgi:hypothetical protein
MVGMMAGMMSASTVVACAVVGTTDVTRLRARGDEELVEEAEGVEVEEFVKTEEAIIGGCQMEGGEGEVVVVHGAARLGRQCGGMRSHTGGDKLSFEYSCFYLCFFFFLLLLYLCLCCP